MERLNRIDQKYDRLEGDLKMASARALIQRGARVVEIERAAKAIERYVDEQRAAEFRRLAGAARSQRISGTAMRSAEPNSESASGPLRIVLNYVAILKQCVAKLAVTCLDMFANFT